MKTEIKKAIAAGTAIGLCNIANILVETKYLGAFLFSLGLLSVIQLDLYLFTGKVGFYDLSKNLRPDLITVIFGNFFGAITITIIGVFAKPQLLASMQQVAENKFAIGFVPIFFLAFLCGVCMQIAVTSKNTTIVILSIMIFILSGFEHCVADIPFLMVISSFSLWNYLKFLLIIAGNATGAIFFRFLTKKC